MIVIAVVIDEVITVIGDGSIVVTVVIIFVVDPVVVILATIVALGVDPYSCSWYGSGCVVLLLITLLCIPMGP